MATYDQNGQRLFGESNEASDDPFDAGNMARAGFLPDVGMTGADAFMSGAGGQRFSNAGDYYDYLYGPGVTREIAGPAGETWYKPPNGIGNFAPGSSPLSIDRPMSMGAKLTLGSILAMAGAGFMGGEAGFGMGETGFGMDGFSGLNSLFSGAGEGAMAGIDYGGLGGGLPGMETLASFAPSASQGSSILDQIRKKYMEESNPWITGLNAFSGLYGLKQSRDIAKAGREGAARMDPFGPQRAQYQTQLSNLMANPSSISNTPGYKAGLDAVERKMASQGYIGSGNMMAALQDYGGNVFNQEANRLAMLAGAGIAPGGGNIEANALTSSAEVSSKALATLGFTAKQIAQILGK
jgi:hypothetical protein